MKIVIPGGSGQVGTLLARAFVSDGHEVVVLSRSAGESPWRVVPGRLLQSGFTFRFPTWAEAAADLCRRWREQRQSKPPG
jgi:NAD dependent epimerase/dehydratase family enzyme